MNKVFLFVKYQKSKKNIQDSNFVLLHPIFSIKFLLEILYIFLKSICYFYNGHFITNS